MDTNAKNTGSYIASLRKEKNLTQQQLADLIGVTNKAVSKWENGQGLPDVGILLKLSAALGVSTDEILGGAGGGADGDVGTGILVEGDATVGAKGGAGAASDTPAITAEHSPPGRAAMTPYRRRTLPRIVGIILSVLGALMLAMQVLYFIANRSFDIQYEIAYFEQLVNVLIALFLFGGLCVLLGVSFRRKTAALLLIAIAAAIVIYLAFAVPIFGPHTASLVSNSPGHQNKLILQTEGETGRTVLLEKRILWFAKHRDTFPFAASPIRFKTQWLTDDVCAVTYMSDSGLSIHQYVATYGDRGDGVSYVSPFSVIVSSGWRTELSESVWSVETTADGISIRQGTEIETYSYSDCVPFGSIAMALCNDGVPKWTIAMNKDCVIENGMIQSGGSITLCRVSMDKTVAAVFESTNPGGGLITNNATYVPKGMQGGNPDFVMQCDYYIDNNRIFFTKDYGETWIPCDLPEDAVAETLSFHRNGLILPEESFSLGADSPVIALLYGGHPSLRISIDNGMTWDTRPAGFIPDGMDRVDYYMNAFTKRFVRFFDAGNGYIGLCSDWSMGMEQQRRAYKTRDGGATWEEFSLPTAGADSTSGNTLTGIIFSDATMEKGVGSLKSDLDTEGYPRVFITEDGGATWDEAALPWDELPQGMLYLKKVYSFSTADGGWELRLGFDKTRVLFAGDPATGEWHYLSEETVTVHTIG